VRLAGAACVLMGLGLYWGAGAFKASEPQAAAVQKTAPALESPPGKRTAVSALARPAQAPCTRFATALSTDPGAPALRVRAKVSHAIETHFRQPMALLALANQGDEAAALALFSLAANCPPYAGTLRLFDLAPRVKQSVAREACRVLPNTLRANPLPILAVAAGGGASFAQTLYAANAPAVLIVRDFYGQLPVGEAKQQLEMAEQFGIRAADAGNNQAYSVMARAYFEGSFGAKDPVHAYAYAFALEQALPSSENSERSAFLRSHVSRGASYAAEQLVRRCAASDGGAQIYRNPFEK
jgi:hypothetical protein